MAFSDSSRQSLVPSFLYSTSPSKSLLFNNHAISSSSPSFLSSIGEPRTGVLVMKKIFVVQASGEPGKIAMYRSNFTQLVLPEVFLAVVLLILPSLLSISSSVICRVRRPQYQWIILQAVNCI